MSQVLIKQNTIAMTRKQFWTLISGGATTLAFWVLEVSTGVLAPPIIVGTAVGMVGAAVGYTLRERA